MDSHRNIRFCDGALGPAIGEAPDLTNMTFSLSVVKNGDVVFLTSDGISDNFDPVIAGKGEASPDFDNTSGALQPGSSPNGDDDEGEMNKPFFSPSERQEQAELLMNEILRTDSMPDDNIFSAVGVCSKLLQYAIGNTNNKRSAQQAANKVLQERAKNRESRSVPDVPDQTAEGLKKHLRSLAGKLDHASVVAYVVGNHGIEEESDEDDREEEGKGQNEAEDGSVFRSFHVHSNKRDSIN